MKPKANEEEDWDENEDEEEEELEIDYEELSPKELYNLCKERDIPAKPKKSSDYYINLLEEADEEDEWQDEDEDEDEEEEE